MCNLYVHLCPLFQACWMYGLWAQDASDLCSAQWHNLASRVRDKQCLAKNNLSWEQLKMVKAKFNTCNSTVFFVYSFVCDGCLKKANKTRKENKYSAKSKLDTFCSSIQFLSVSICFICVYPFHTETWCIRNVTYLFWTAATQNPLMSSPFTI